VAAVALLLIALASGCGGGGDTQLSKAEFLKQANAICTKAHEKEQAKFAVFLKAHSESHLNPNDNMKALVLIIGVPAIRTQVEELEALRVPTGDAEKIAAIITGIKKGLKEVEDRPLRVNNGPDPFTESNTLASKYGLKACANGLA
jgi:hypothetical protein